MKRSSAMENKIKSIEELRALRDKVRSDVELRSGEKKIRVVVHMGTCGIAAGARDILAQIIDELSRTAIDTVTVRTSGCLGLCDQEPMLTLTDGAGNEFCYGKLDQKRVQKIVKQHIIENEPVAEYMVTT